MRYKIAFFAGDGVGPELINEGIKLIDKAAELDKFEIEWIKYPHCSEHYLETKELLSEDILKEIKNNCNAIYCGTFDNFILEPQIKVQGIPTMIRNYFDQFASIRPIKLLPSVESSIAGKTYKDIDFVIIREFTEDFYVGASGKARKGKNKQLLEINKNSSKIKLAINIEARGNEVAYQIGVLSRKACDRIIKYAFDYSKINNNKKITFIDKADKLDYYNFWRESVDKIAKEYPGLEYEFSLIDTTVMQFIRQPERFKVIVAPNMFGDVLQDLGTIIQGGLAFGARGNINPEGISMFEPIHACAYKLKGHGIVNPIATLWAGALLLENIGQKKASDLTMKAIEAVLKDGRMRTQDLDGHNTTSEMADAIIDKFVELHD